MSKNAVRRRRVIPPLLFAALLGLGAQTAPTGGGVQNPDPTKRSATEYMRSLTNSTKPLNIIVDKTLQKLVRQPTIAWAARAARRHILD
jgi:hypothetical protein